MPEAVLRALSRSDSPSVARIHCAAFPNSYLAALGPRTVERYYAWQLLGPHDVTAVGAYLEGELAGFCFGGVFRGAMSGFLRRNWAFLLGQVLARPVLWRHALFRKRFGEGVRLLKNHSPWRKRPVDAARGRPANSFAILAIAVHPRCQGLGIGSLLVEECGAVALRNGFRKMHLTVNSDNQQAIRFYERSGWTRVIESGVWNGRFEKPLSLPRESVAPVELCES